MRWREAVRRFLRDHLKLELRSGGDEPFRVSKGVDFVGWKTWWSHRVPRWRTLRNLDHRLSELERSVVRLETGEPGCRSGVGIAIGMGIDSDSDTHPDPACAPGESPVPERGEMSGNGVREKRGIISVRLEAQFPGPGATRQLASERIGPVLASYSGHLRHGAAWNQWSEVLGRHRWLDALFTRKGWKITARWKPRRISGARSFARQYRELIRQAGEGTLLFCPIGRFIELRGPQRIAAERILGLRRAYLPRAGFAFAAGFPIELAPIYRSRALRQGWSVAIIGEKRTAWVHRCRPRTVEEIVILPRRVGDAAGFDLTDRRASLERRRLEGSCSALPRPRARLLVVPIRRSQ